MSAPSLSPATAFVRGLYESFANGDVSRVLASLSEDIVWNEAENYVYADGNPYRGPRAVLDGVFMRLATEWDDYRVAFENSIAEENRVAVFGRYTGTYKKTGKSVNAQFVHVWTIAQGKVARFQQYTDTLQFARAVDAA